MQSELRAGQIECCIIGALGNELNSNSFDSLPSTSVNISTSTFHPPSLTTCCIDLWFGYFFAWGHSPTRPKVTALAASTS